MERTRVKDALASTDVREHVNIKGWVRTRRDVKSFSFIEVNDGSSLHNIQVVVDRELPDYRRIEDAVTGAAVSILGRLVASQGKGQVWELVAESISVVGPSDSEYPLQKKGHSVEFLREIAHLRPRSNLFGCVIRLRNRLAYAAHNFFQDRGFLYVHTPIITASDCEGAGELFRVTSLDLGNPPLCEESVDYAKDFFRRPTYLTVSGQLEAEILACAMSSVYTFGPTFRAENSNTSRHASEFWMIEPEMAFCDLEGNMDLAEEFIKYLIDDALTHCPEEVGLFGRFVDRGLRDRLNFVLERPFKRIPYADAVDLLRRAGREFEYAVENDTNLQAEHERYLTEELFKCPVTVYDYPIGIKPFYMRMNADGRTVAAMDLLVPGIGELVGGSQREERLDQLLANMERHGISKEHYWWYVDLRRFGTVEHSGFGLGFERMLMFVSGVANIRDVIPFARTPGNAEF